MADQPLFGEGAPAASAPATPATPASGGTQDHGMLGVLVGEGRKYRDIDALVKGHLHADDHIAKIEEENRRLREQVQKAATMEEVLRRLPAAPQSGDTTPASATPVPVPASSDIAAIVRQTVTGLETEKTRQANRQRAEAAMRELYGDKAKQVFEAEATTVEQRTALSQLAEVAPEKFIAIFKPADKPMPAMLGSTANTTVPARVDRSGDTGTREYWDKLRKENPKAYYSHDMQLAKQKAALADPDKFFGRR